MLRVEIPKTNHPGLTDHWRISQDARCCLGFSIHVNGWPHRSQETCRETAVHGKLIERCGEVHPHLLLVCLVERHVPNRKLNDGQNALWINTAVGYQIQYHFPTVGYQIWASSRKAIIKWVTQSMLSQVTLYRVPWRM